ncbi:MAG: hypothetical protein IJ542_02425 [Clostridia bacterium]|nr:hypothetical protein [Clostridia bacterium]
MTQEILKYQEIDGKLLKLEKALKEMPERQKEEDMRNVLRNSQSRISLIEKNAQKTTENFARAKAYYEDLVIKIETLSKTVDEMDYNKIKETQQAKNSFYQMLEKLEKEIVKINAQLTAVNNEYVSVIKNAKNAKQNLEIYRARLAEADGKYAPQVAELKKELAEQEKLVDKKILERYKAKRESRFPVIVKVVNGTCGGCRMAISASKMQDFDKKGYVECENCGRIITKQ